ncbi:hypothetical protein D3C85_1459570 [compost metagenome]
MLEHADRGDLVERGVGLQLAVVAQLDAHTLLQAARRDQLRHIGMLIARQRDAAGLHAIVLGRPKQQPAPARADVEKALAGTQLQLAADMVELGFLGLGQIHVRLAVVGTGIDAARIEP